MTNITKVKKYIKHCSVIILAAGFSSRMGSPKFAIKFNGNKTFLEEIIQQYSDFGCQKIVVVLNKSGIDQLSNHNFTFPKHVILVENKHPEWERFYSLKIGIESINNDFPVFIHNVDNPFINHNTLQKLFSHSDKDYVVPVYQDKGGHPILISNKVGNAILLEKHNEMILSHFLNRFTKTRIQVNEKNVLVNINSKEKYSKYFKK